MITQHKRIGIDDEREMTRVPGSGEGCEEVG